jgi:cytochrome subunit of sulfide dehydrogenase
MTGARAARCDVGSEPRAAVTHHGTPKALRLRQVILLSVATSVLILIANRSMAAENSRGAQLAAICTSCHRLDGRDKGIPSIVGLTQKEFADVMAAFKSAARSSQIMHAIALSLSDGEVATLAEYLAAQPTGTKPP